VARENRSLSGLLEFFDKPVQYLKGVGPKRATILSRMGISTLEDLLFLFPKDYEDKRFITPISQLKAGNKGLFQAQIWNARILRSRKPIFEVTFKDPTGIVKGKWFNFQQHMVKSFQPGQTVLVFGNIQINRYECCLEVIHPQVEFVKEGSERKGHVLPLYPLTEGLNQTEMRKAQVQALKELKKVAQEYLPSRFLKEMGYPPFYDALREAHYPKEEDPSRLRNRQAASIQRFVFEEFFFLQLVLALKRGQIKKEKGISFQVDGPLFNKLLSSLPYELTEAQKRVLEEIRGDMASPQAMNRLMQGDVGCGKTVVAFLSMAIAVDSGYQVAMMAPTEILAEQHFLGMREMLTPLGIQCVLLVSGISKSERSAVLSGLSSGTIDIVIGTHAIIQEDVRFHQLGLVIIDEQHRFGVLQRVSLRGKGKLPDLLVMTATPIPRTLGLTLYGDLDVSVIDELPQGRIPIKTKVVEEHQRSRTYNFIKEQLEKGRQAYVVFPLIEESEKLQLPSVLEMHPKIAEVFRPFKVGLLHGRMSREEKEKVMLDFKNNGLQLLVSTTVIEVGIDVPNATIMMIEGAERFGLSQLHQLRGRVGRGDHASYCFLMASKRLSPLSRLRLNVMEKTSNGFEIAEEDLKIRGPGDFLGVRQSGLPPFKVANLLTDAPLLQKAREEAFRLVDEDPNLEALEHRDLKSVLLHKGYHQTLDHIGAG
jgi:ATP-dependent DNA helicase RecG